MEDESAANHLLSICGFIYDPGSLLSRRAQNPINGEDQFGVHVLVRRCDGRYDIRAYQGILSHVRLSGRLRTEEFSLSRADNAAHNEASRKKTVESGILILIEAIEAIRETVGGWNRILPWKEFWNWLYNQI